MKNQIKKFFKAIGLYTPVVKSLQAGNTVLHNMEEARNKKNRIRFFSGFLHRNDLVFDVGANVGNRVQPFLQLGCRVVAVEPQEQCYRILEEKFGSSIEIVKMGLGAQEDKKTMYIATESTISSLSQEWIESVKKDRFKQFDWNETVTINITTLDKLISQYGKPDFCKIDVEGYEYEVLKGLSQPLKFISLEYTVPEQTNRLTDCIRYCLNLDAGCLFNYSKGESMEYALPQFLPGQQFLEHVHTAAFQETKFGDIYVKSTKD